MNRTRVPRALASATASAAIVLGLLAGSTGAALGADSRMVYFGDPATENHPGGPAAGAGKLVLTPVTTGGVFTFDVIARNTGNQTLTHSVLALGTAAAARTADDYANSAIGSIPNGTPSLPAASTGVEIISATVVGASCPAATPTSFSCAIGNFGSGAVVRATFVVKAPTSALSSWVWASFKVAENVNDQGSNRNTFYADGVLNVAQTTTDLNGTYLLGTQALKLSTNLANRPASDPMVSTVEVPGEAGGLVTISEQAVNPALCTPKCIGQQVSVNVRNGASFGNKYVRWTLVVFTTDVTPSKGGIYHVLDDGTTVETIPNTKANSCSAAGANQFKCIESYVVNKKLGTTTIIFHTATNGAVRAN